MHIIEYPAVPLTSPIYGGFNHDAEVRIHANIMAGPSNGFIVEFLSAEGIALHINVRMGLYGGENVIVFNSLRHGQWQQEIRHHNVFFINQHFHMSVKAHHDHFSIHANGSHLMSFGYRESPFNVHTLSVKGDLSVQKIHFENFRGQNGGGMQIGGGVAPTTVVMTAPAPTVVVAPAPRPAVVIAPAPRPLIEVVVPPRRPIVEVVVPPRRPIVEVVVPPRRPLFGGPVVVVEKGRHGHRHGHH